jgi:hypothetical protein
VGTAFCPKESLFNKQDPVNDFGVRFHNVEVVKAKVEWRDAPRSATTKKGHRGAAAARTENLIFRSIAPIIERKLLINTLYHAVHRVAAAVPRSIMHRRFLRCDGSMSS